MGTCTLMTFVIVVYGKYDSELGVDCNKSFSERCRPVFRARAAVFAELTWLILVSAWEFKSLRRSLFRLRARDSRPFPIFQDIYENKFLFWAVVLAALSVFPVVYIPVLNEDVFKHTGISWEWGLVVAMTIVYVVGVELWKDVKRTWQILDDYKGIQSEWFQGSEDGKRMSFSTTLRSIKSWGRSDSRGKTFTAGSVSNV